MKKVNKFFSVLMFIGIVLTAIPMTVFATEPIPTPTPIPYTRTISISNDQYITFGDANYPADVKYGIEVQADIESTATYWINLSFETTQQLIIDNEIEKFYVLANGKIIDVIYVDYVDTNNDGEYEPIPWYIVKPESWGLAGGDVTFQIVGVTPEDSAVDNIESVVIWSNVTPLIHMDPVKVNDAEAISVLHSILAKLNEMLSALSGKLESIKSELHTLFTPSPQAESRLDAAMQNLLNQTPMGQQTQHNEEMKNMFENTQLDQPYEKLTFGDKRDWFGIGTEFYLLDLTELQEQIELLRNLLAAIIWIEFFVWLVFYLSPKLNL